MPSRERVNLWRGLWAALPALLLALLLPALAAPVADPPTQADVEKVRAALQADPNLNAKETQRYLKRREETPSKPKPDKPEPASKREERHSDRDGPSGFANGLAEAGRVLIWVLGGVALVFVLFGLRRWVRAGAFRREAPLADLPSHVRDLDIRPDSLPELVGQTAWSLWQRGEQRAALSLLYRAMLSRLVHVHAVPILSASTEGECVELARGRLGVSQMDYVERIVQAWQMTVYGARHPEALAIQGLCQRFDAELPTPTASIEGGARP